MDNERFMRAFGEIDDEYLQTANELYNIWQESQKGVSVRADVSQRFSWRTVIASAACTAAVLFGVFVLLLNIGKIKLSESSEQSESSYMDESVDLVIDGEPAELFLYHNVEGAPSRCTVTCKVKNAEDAVFPYYAECTNMENCTVIIKERNTLYRKSVFISPIEPKRNIRTQTDDEWIYLEVTLVAIDPDRSARVNMTIGAGKAYF